MGSFPGPNQRSQEPAATVFVSRDAYDGYQYVIQGRQKLTKTDCTADFTLCHLCSSIFNH